MFRLWAKIFKENRMIKDMVVCNDEPELRRTQILSVTIRRGSQKIISLIRLILIISRFT
jgi:hypothetical protein